MTICRLQAGELPQATAAWLHRRTLLGSIEFARLWETMGGQVIYWAASDGDRIVALLPGLEFGQGRLARYQAMPDGLYATLLFPEGKPADPTAIAEALLERLAARKYARVFINDYYAQFGHHDLFKVRDSQTLLVDISSDAWQPPDKKLQSEIRKAGREKIRLQVFSFNRHFDSFLDLMKHTERRHGRKPKYPDAFYRALGKLAMTDNRVKWLVCEHEGKLAASHIYLVENDMALNWQVFFDKSFSFLKPNQFITYSVARELALRGVALLNLGATPRDAETLDRYKQKWGGRSHQYHCLERKSLLGRWL